VLELFQNKFKGETIYNNDGEVMLYIAYKVNNLALIDFLIQKCSVKSTLLNEDNSSILHGMALCKDYKFGDILIDIIDKHHTYSMSITRKNKKGFTWLDYLLMTHPDGLHKETIEKLYNIKR
jgi:hypothetical protein